MFGETHDRADQMPGGTGLHETFRVARYYTGSGFTAHTINSSMWTSNSTWYGFSKVAAGSYDIWDKACAS